MICSQCGKEFSGNGGLCNTCQVRNFLSGVSSPTVPCNTKSNARVESKPSEVRKSYGGLPNGMVVRICLSCGSVYLAYEGNSFSVVPCRYCEGVTGFFETVEHFFKYIILYGLNKKDVRDIRVSSMLATNFKSSSDGAYYEM